MRITRIEALGLVVLLVAVTLIAGQPGPAKSDDEKPAAIGKEEKKAPPKSKLEEMLEQALRHNPDIHVAEAKMREAEAELNRTRLLVTQKVVTLNASLDIARANVAFAEAQLTRIQALYKTGNIPTEEVNKATSTLQQAKAELTKLEAETPYITGQPPKEAKIDPAVERGLRYLRRMQAVEEAHRATDEHAAAALLWLAQSQRATASDNPAADKIRAALDKPVSLNVKEMPFPDILKSIELETGLKILYKPATNPDPIYTVRVEVMPTGALMQLLEDQATIYRVVVRDYGLFVMPSDRDLPRGAVPLHDFWKSGKKEVKDQPDKK